jgi:hypothetical protein
MGYGKVNVKELILLLGFDDDLSRESVCRPYVCNSQKYSEMSPNQRVFRMLKMREAIGSPPSWSWW